jgi:hypothetical protein
VVAKDMERGVQITKTKAERFHPFEKITGTLCCDLTIFGLI